MNGGGTYSVLMAAEYDSGSGGGGDVIVLVPSANFNPANGYFLYFYTAMGFQGGDWSGTGTFEEWSALTQPAAFSISGTKYTDVTGNGITADDTGLGGVTIFIDKDNSGTLNAGDLSTTTAADGTWSFTGLDSTYNGMKVYEVLPNGYVETVGTAGYTINGTSGQDQPGMNFANFKKFDISGTKYTDVTGIGITADDTGLGGVTIFNEKDNSGTLNANEQTT